MARGPLPIVHATAASRLPPFPIEAFVIEQDRDLLLEWQSELRVPEASYASLVHAMREAPRPEPGSVLVRGSAAPFTLVAVVHDFEVEPSWREAWVAAALAATLRACAERGIGSVALPLLGTVHGRLPAARAAALLAAALSAAPGPAPARAWLLLPAATAAAGVLRPLVDAGLEVVAEGA